MPSEETRKKVLFFPLNSPGHVNSSLGIADRLKQDFNYETIFLIIGESFGDTIREHGHESIVMDEIKPLEDYEISSDEDTTKPLDEAAAIAKGKKKIKFPGSKKWPQVLMRYQYLIRLPPVESFLKCHDIFEKSMLQELMDNDEKCKLVINQIKPSLIVIDAYFIPPCIVTYKGCPWVKLFSANPLGLFDSKLSEQTKICGMIGAKLYTKEQRLKMRKENPEKWEALVANWKSDFKTIVAKMSEGAPGFEEFLKSQNCPPVPFGKQTHDSPYINFYMYPKELDYDQDDDILKRPDRWFRCDSLVRDIKTLKDKDLQLIKEWEAKFEEAKKGKKEVIFFSLGSIASGDYRLMKKYIDIFSKDLDRLYVVSKGINGNKFQLNEKNMIGGNFIPQTLFLQKVDLAIIHGGNNSVTECVYYGVPMIVLPAFGDQADNAQRIEDLKMGKRLDAFNVDENKLFEAIDSVLSDDDLIRRAKEISERMKGRNGEIKASLILKKLIEEGDLSQNFIEECREKETTEINW